MNLQYKFRNIATTEALKTHLKKRVDKLSKFVSYEIEVTVYLSKEKVLHCAEITCHAEHRQIVAVAKTKDLYESIDLAAHKIEAQLKKEREKRKGHGAAHKVSRKGIKLAQDVGAQVPHLEKIQR